MNIVFSPVALADLLEIGAYIARDNPTRALRFVDELETHCQQLGQAPGIGVQRPDLAEGIRMRVQGHDLIFDREDLDCVRIDQVLHSARDIAPDDLKRRDAR
jgi:toxin ParE1/3/4